MFGSCLDLLGDDVHVLKASLDATVREDTVRTAELVCDVSDFLGLPYGMSTGHAQRNPVFISQGLSVLKVLPHTSNFGVQERFGGLPDCFGSTDVYLIGLVLADGVSMETLNLFPGTLDSSIEGAPGNAKGNSAKTTGKQQIRG